MTRKKSEIYCGIQPLKPNQRQGTMKECVAKKQVRFYGKNKIDPKILEDRQNLVMDVTTMRKKVKRLSKEYEKPSLKRTERVKIKKELDSSKKYLHMKLNQMKKTGGKLKVKDIHDLIVDSRDQKGDDVGDFKLDKDLSTSSTKVYFNPHTKQAVVTHRGTNTFEDVITDIGALFGLESYDRFGNSMLTQSKAEDKYGAKNVTTLGFSLGGLLAKKYGLNSKEILTYNPLTLFNNSANAPNEQTIKTKTDWVSALKKPHKDDIVISVDSINPNEVHKLEHLNKLNPDMEVGKGMNFKKMKVIELKNFIKKNRKASKQKILITGLKKKDLINIACSL
jgi:hypothetical protein